MKAIVCDRCGAILPKAGDARTIAVDRTMSVYCLHDLEEYHLCKCCYRKLLEFIGRGDA